MFIVEGLAVNGTVGADRRVCPKRTKSRTNHKSRKSSQIKYFDGNGNDNWNEVTLRVEGLTVS